MVHLERHRGTEFARMVEMYERSGLIYPFMLESLRPLLAESATTWRRLHEPNSNLAFTLLARTSADILQGAISGVRAWDETWFVQHLAAVSGAEIGLSSRLQIACLDLVLSRPDTRHVSFFVSTQNAGMNAGLEKFWNLGERSEVASRIELALWVGPTQAALTSNPVRGCSPMQAGAEELVAQAAERALGRMTASALSLLPGAPAPELGSTAARFAELGLERSRTASLIWKGERASAVLLKEHAAPGLNLTGLLNAWWLLPSDCTLGVDLPAAAAAAAHIASREGWRAHGTLLLTPKHVPHEALSDAGFSKQMDAFFYTLSRSGAREYATNLASRYEQLQATLKRRNARSSARARDH